jgi:hypothetical protein
VPKALIFKNIPIKLSFLDTSDLQASIFIISIQRYILVSSIIKIHYLLSPMATRYNIITIYFLIFIFYLSNKVNSKPININLSLIKNLRKSLAILPFFLQVSNAVADYPNFKTYENQRYHTRFEYPSSWQEASGRLSGDRTITAFVDPVDQTTSASIVFTPIPADFSKLGSFGGPDSLRSFILPRGDNVETSVVSENIKGDKYTLEYIISSPELLQQHVTSVFALRSQETVVAPLNAYIDIYIGIEYLEWIGSMGAGTGPGPAGAALSA